VAFWRVVKPLLFRATVWTNSDAKTKDVKTSIDGGLKMAKAVAIKKERRSL
jgi:hypothetical protein